jgi:dethiobiotin synthetase
MPEAGKFSVFVTGTDTGVGKTLVSTALLQALARHYQRVVGMKPVAAGTAMYGGLQANDDVIALRAASNLRVAPELDNPVLLADPVSPHIAARRAGMRIDIGHIAACHQALMQLADAVVVEGAGGFMVPLTDDATGGSTGADLAVALKLPLLLVVGLRLGCLNHALLTAEAIRSRGLTLAGWAANHVDCNMAEQQENVSFLRRALGAPLLASIAWQPDATARNVTMELPDLWLPGNR